MMVPFPLRCDPISVKASSLSLFLSPFRPVRLDKENSFDPILDRPSLFPSVTRCIWALSHKHTYAGYIQFSTCRTSVCVESMNRLTCYANGILVAGFSFSESSPPPIEISNNLRFALHTPFCVASRLLPNHFSDNKPETLCREKKHRIEISAWVRNG